MPARSLAVRTQLRDLGYVEGRNIRLEFRNASGNVDRLPALAEEIVREGDVDVIVTTSFPAAMAAYRATQTIPIVAFVAGDPVASGLAKSLAHPGGNVTGVAIFAEETSVPPDFCSASISSPREQWVSNYPRRCSRAPNGSSNKAAEPQSARRPQGDGQGDPASQKF
jgi:hypothetical protein